MRILVVLAMALVIALSPKGTEPEFMQVWATAEDTTTFLITEGQQEGNLYSIYDDELEQGEQYLLTIDDKGTEDWNLDNRRKHKACQRTFQTGSS